MADPWPPFRIEKEMVERRDAYLHVLERMRRYPFNHLVMRLTVPTVNPMVFPSDQPLLLTHIAVPPQEYDPQDELGLIVGDRYQFTAPVQYLIDSYPIAPIEPAAALYHEIEQQFAVLMDKVEQQQLPDEALAKLRTLHDDLWLKNQHLGVAVNVVVPPRVNYQFSLVKVREPQNGFFVRGNQSSDGRLTVFVSAYYTRDVA